MYQASGVSKWDKIPPEAWPSNTGNWTKADRLPEVDLVCMGVFGVYVCVCVQCEIGLRMCTFPMVRVLSS